MTEELKKLRGEHCLNIFVSFEIKQRITELATRYDRTMADIVRSLIRVGLPVMEGLSQAEEEMLNDYVRLFRRMRKMRDLKDV
jgi:predicted DNA-binding protein